jgi:4-amino-4-deoxy-L-arabinose transferase-like glycosyltransferase
MFRFNDPDALLVLLCTVAAYCLTRAVETASWRWMVLLGVAMGAAFLTKMLQGFLVLPGLAAAYLLVAPTTWRTRLLQLAAAAGALVVSAGWWILAVQLVPAASRPYVGGSSDDTVLDLAFGYNGIRRLEGRHASSGPGRLFHGEMGVEISWLLPVAVAAVAFGGLLALRGRLGRGERAGVVAWGGWLVVTALVLGYMRGTVHPYYTVALAPAIAALTGLASVWAWRSRAGWDGRVALAGLLGLGAWWSTNLLHQNHFGPHWLPRVLLATSVVAAAAVLVGRRGLVHVGLGAGACAALAGTVAFSIATVATPHHGAVPDAVSLGARAQAGRSWTGDEATNRDLAALLVATTTPWSAATNGSQSAAALELATHTSVMAIGGWSEDPTPTLDQFVDDVRAGRIAYYVEAGRGGQTAPTGRVIRGPNHGASHNREIADWVADHYRAVTVGSSLVYRLTALTRLIDDTIGPASGSSSGTDRPTRSR